MNETRRDLFCLPARSARSPAPCGRWPRRPCGCGPRRVGSPTGTERGSAEKVAPSGAARSTAEGETNGCPALRAVSRTMSAGFHRDHRGGVTRGQGFKAFPRGRHRVLGFNLPGGVEQTIRAPTVSQIQSQRVIFGVHKREEYTSRLSSLLVRLIFSFRVR